MLRIVRKQYMLLNQATEAFSAGMMAYLQRTNSLPAVHNSDLMSR